MEDFLDIIRQGYTVSISGNPNESSYILTVKDNNTKNETEIEVSMMKGCIIKNEREMNKDLLFATLECLGYLKGYEDGKDA